MDDVGLDGLVPGEDLLHVAFRKTLVFHFKVTLAIGARHVSFCV